MSRPKKITDDTRDSRAFFEDADERLEHDAIDDAIEILHGGATDGATVERLMSGRDRATDRRLW